MLKTFTNFQPMALNKIPLRLKWLFTLVCLLLTSSMFAQTTTIQKVTASGCYFYSNASKTTISVQVAWTGANSSDIITVKVDNDITRIINVEDMYDPGTGSNVAGPIKSPQVVAFEINADGLSHTITAVMTGAHSSSATPVAVTAPSPCTPMSCVSGNLGGMVFNDNNSDGIKQAGESVGIPNVTVTAYDVNGVQYTATSDASGNYAFSSANANSIPLEAYPVRIEFSNFPAFVFGNSGPSITGNESSVRFVNAPVCNLNCGAVNPLNYSQANPIMVSNMYTNNNPLAGGTAATTPTLIAHTYTNETNFNYTTLAASSEIGSVWAKTWNKFKKKMLVAAFLKRHCGLGPLGVGGIYMVDYTNQASPVFSNFLDVTTLGIDVGQGVIPDNVTRGMGASKTARNTDAQSYAYIGKAGIGNMDLSDDGNILYFVNLFDRKVYTINLTNYFANGTMPTALDVNNIVIPDPGCTGGDFRPFALKIRDGNMYVGMVCDGSGGNTSNMVAFVKSYNIATNVWSDVFDFPLTYPKGYPDQQDGSKTGWFIWSDNPSVVNPGNSSSILHPVPILSDIEFDMDGTMVIALMDRTCHQYGVANNDSWNGAAWGSSNFFIAAGGDVLRAFYSNGAYVLENAAKAGPTVGYAPANNQGPGFGEFYNDNIGGGVNYHSEMGTGGLALRPGSGEIIAGMVDPSFYKGDGVLYANGIRKMSNTTGQPTGGKSYYSDSGISLFGKANGMGDIELVADNVAHIEIGNYVWKDSDLDGVQDPNESGMAGITLKIYNASTGALVGTTTSDANGNYYFSSLNGVTLLPNTIYNVLIGDNQYNVIDSTIMLNGIKYKITLTNTGQGSNAIMNDNNFDHNNLTTALGAMPANIPFVQITTGDLGYVNHTIDLGLKALPGLGDTVWNDINVNGIQDIGEAPIQNLKIYLLDAVGSRIDSTFSNANGYYEFINLHAGVNYQVEFTVPGIFYASTLPNVGGNDSIDSDIDAFYKTQQVILSYNEFNQTLDAGFFECTKPQAGANTTACGGSCLDITGTNPTNGLWTAAGNNPIGATLGSTTGGVANVCFVNNASGIFQFIYNSGLCSDTMEIDVTPLPTADAGANQNLDCSTTSAMIGSNAIVGLTYAWLPTTGLSDAAIAQPIASPTVTTTYTVTATGANACFSTATVTVFVNTVAPTPSISGTTTVCNGSTVTLTASGGVSYLWNTLETSASIIAGVGNYTVTATAANGCTATATTIVENVQGNIGNYVWYDANGNGVNDESAISGINGLTVELWKETFNGSNIYVLDQSTLTNNDINLNPGYYNFAICESANYKVKFPTSSGGQGLTKPTTTPATDNNSDANTNDGFSPPISIDINGAGVAKDNTTIDAGYYKPAQLGNYVWNDINKDGIQDANEVGVAGIVVTLMNNSNVAIANTITDAYGYYKFNPLEPGIYSVKFTLPANYVFTLQDVLGDDNVDNDVNTITGQTGNYTLIAGDSNMTVDAGIYFERPYTASVGNYVWLDMDEDGIQDANEEGISGVTVTLYNNLGNAVATMYTDANGYYLFTNVLPGTYTIGFTQKPSLAFSPNNDVVSNPSNSDANPITGLTSSFVVNAGDEITYVDAGMYPINNNFPLLGGLGDRVWFDLNQDGVQNAGEIGVGGVTVTLYQADGITVLNTTTTNTFGDYIFNNLPQGEYMIGFSNLPVGFSFTTTAGTDSTTNSDADLITGKTAIISLAPGQYNLTYDAGIYDTNPLNNNSIGDRVWDDVNKNGIQDINELGVDGVTVTLYDNNNNVIAITSTNTDGYYLFPNLPNGTFYVGFSNLPLGYVFSQTGQGTTETDSDPNTSTGLTAPVILVGGTHITDLDAGINLGNTRIGLGTLGDLVWYDMNNNGLQDVNESGVQGVIATLYTSDGVTVLATTTTNALGNYIFTGLDEGSYKVGFTNLPVGFTISPKDADAQGINGEINSDVNVATQLTDLVTLGVGEDKMSVDMGITPPAGTASLGNFVWFDLNNDGLQTSGEPGVQGVSVTLFDNTGNAIANTTTSANGEYYFIGLNPGTYSVGFNNLPNGYTFTTYDADALGINGSSNSDADQSTGMTMQVTLAVNDNNLNLDAGIVSTTVASVGDYVWYDVNQDGIQDASENGIGGVLVTLYNDAQLPVASTITLPDGSYIFTNVTPGTYTMGFSNTPEGMVFTQQVGGPFDNNNSNVDPSNGITASFVVVAGTHNPTIDAGLTTPIIAGLGNYVWHDVNINGLQDAGEPGVAGVLVTLYDASGTVVLSSNVTDGNGAYSFTHLVAGTYVVGFSNLPSGSTRTQNVGVINDPLNSDMNLGGKTEAITLSAGEFNPNIDAGIYYGIPLNAKELTATLAIIKDVNTCEVNWYTVDEKNTSSFDIERSIDGAHFEKVGNVNAGVNTNGRTNYQFNDNISSISNEKVIYYKIKLIDVDHKVSYSNTINVQQGNMNQETVMIYPSPFTDIIHVDYMSADESALEMELTDLAGRTIQKKQQEVTKGINRLTIENLHALSTGNYFLKLIDINTGEVFISKIAK